MRKLAALYTLSRIMTGGNKMGVLDQIENIIKNKVKNEKGQEIIDLTFSNYTGKMTYFLNVDCVIQEFSSKKKLVNFMNKNGWRINTLSKS